MCAALGGKRTVDVSSGRIDVSRKDVLRFAIGWSGEGGRRQIRSCFARRVFFGFARQSRRRRNVAGVRRISGVLELTKLNRQRSRRRLGPPPPTLDIQRPRCLSLDPALLKAVRREPTVRLRGHQLAVVRRRRRAHRRLGRPVRWLLSHTSRQFLERWRFWRAGQRRGRVPWQRDRKGQQTSKHGDAGQLAIQEHRSIAGEGRIGC